MSEKTAIVLGGTIPHKYLINNLKKRDFHTILIDYHENPTARIDADEHIQESTLDKGAVLEIAQKRNVSLVISGCVDQANTTACYVLEQMSLHTPYSYQASLRVTNKELMKEGMVNAGISTAKYDLLSIENYNSYMPEYYPKVVKPCDANGSKGVRKVSNDIDLKLAVYEAIALSRNGKAIVEDLIQGVEINIYCLIDHNKKSKILYIKSKKLPNLSKKSALQSFFSIGPYEVSQKLKEKIEETADLIAKEFNLINTPILIQAIVENDNIFVIEFAPRVGGGLAFREIEYHTGFDLIDAVVDSYLGINITQNNFKTPSMLSSVTHFYGKMGVLDRVVGLEELVSSKTIKEYHLNKTKGMNITAEDLASRNRVFGVIVLGNSINEIKDKLDKVVETVKVLNCDGEDVLLKVSFDELF